LSLYSPVQGPTPGNAGPGNCPLHFFNPRMTSRSKIGHLNPAFHARQPVCKVECPSQIWNTLDMPLDTGMTNTLMKLLTQLQRCSCQSRSAPSRWSTFVGLPTCNTMSTLFHMPKPLLLVSPLHSAVQNLHTDLVGLISSASCPSCLYS